MRKMIGLAGAALALVPAIASAQSAELWHDRQEIREERRDLARARRTGDPRQIREERRELAQAQREYRRDSWRELRERNRERYRVGRYHAPRGYSSGYHRWSRGSRVNAAYYGRTYRIADPRYYGLPPSGRFQGWVRYYNDVMLIDVRDGRVYDVIPNFFY